MVAQLVVASPSAALTTPAKRRRVATRTADRALDSLGDALLAQQQEADIQCIVNMLRSDPDKILRTKAFLSSSLSSGGGPTKFVKGVVSMETVPFKFKKEILCAVT
eukprot:92411-Lingulodinium_polyedra.AAC.1